MKIFQVYFSQPLPPPFNDTKKGEKDQNDQQPKLDSYSSFFDQPQPNPNPSSSSSVLLIDQSHLDALKAEETWFL